MQSSTVNLFFTTSMRLLVALLLAFAVLHTACSPLHSPSAASLRGGQRRGAASCAVQPRQAQLVAAYAPTGRSGDFGTKKASDEDGEDPVQTWVIACGLGWLYGLGCIVGPFYGVGALLSRRRTLAPTLCHPELSGPHASFAKKHSAACVFAGVGVVFPVGIIAGAGAGVGVVVGIGMGAGGIWGSGRGDVKGFKVGVPMAPPKVPELSEIVARARASVDALSDVRGLARQRMRTSLSRRRGSAEAAEES